MSTTTQDLKSWTQQRLTALWSAPDDSSFHSEFEKTFASAEHAKLTRNNEKIEIEDYKNDLQKMRAPMVKADVEFGDIDILNSDSNDSEIVKGSCTVKRSLKFRVRAAPAQTQRVINFTATVGNSGDNSEEDTRRIVSLDETVEDKPVPINISPLAHHKEGNGEPDPDAKS